MRFVVDEEGLLKKVKKVAIKDRKIEIPNNVKKIGSSVFFAFKKIKEIIIPSSVEIIGEYAFQDCLNIENIILPSSIKSIERGAFYGCKKLKSITIPYSVEKLGESCFLECKNLERIEILGNIEVLNPYTFEDCGNLKIVKLPKSLKKITPFAFQNNKIEKIILGNKDTLIETALRWEFESFNYYYIDKLTGEIVASKSEEQDENLEKLKYEEYRNILNCQKVVAVYASLFFDINTIKKNKFLKILLPMIINYPNSYSNCEIILNNLDNYKEFEHLTRKIFDKFGFHQDDRIIYYDFYKLAFSLGAFSDNHIDRQKACEFLSNAIDKKNIDFKKLHVMLESFKFQDYNKEWRDFFMNKGNFASLIDFEKGKKGFIARIANSFEEIKEFSRSNRGAQRFRQITVKTCVEYLSKVNFDKVNGTNIDISNTISKYTRNQESFDMASEIRKEYLRMREEGKIDDHILKEELKEDAFALIEEEKKSIVEGASSTISNLENIARNSFSYEFLSKYDPDNFVIGKYCSCCAHLEGIGVGIMKASILHPDCQNLVIRNKEGRIVAKSTLYLNREKGYGLFNNIEIDDNIVDRKSKILIYNKYILAIKEFVRKYNEKFPNEPIRIINVGMGLNDLESELLKKHKISKEILRGIDFSEYGGHMGDWQFKQLTIWEEELEKRRMK